MEQLAEQTHLSRSALGSYEARIPTVHGCESYVNGVAVKQVKSANTIVDAMSATHYETA